VFGNRRPSERPRAGACDFATRHLAADLIANPHPCLPRARRRGGSRQVESLTCLDDIARHALSLVVEQPQRILREAVALLSSSAIPHCRLGVVLRHASPGLEHVAEPSLRGRDAAFGKRDEEPRTKSWRLSRRRRPKRLRIRKLRRCEREDNGKQDKGTDSQPLMPRHPPHVAIPTWIHSQPTSSRAH